MKKLTYILLALSIAVSGCASTPQTRPAGISALQPHTVSIGGVKYVPLRVVCDKYGYKWSWDVITRKAGIQKDASYYRFLEGSNFVYSKNQIYRMNYPAVLRDGSLMVPALFAQDKILPPRQRTAAKASVRKKRPVRRKALARRKTPIRRKAARKRTVDICPTQPSYFKKVVIDAGHGGKDPGAVGSMGTKEKDITLDIAGRLRRKLQACGIKSYMTRFDDKFVSLRSRAQMANRKEADLFISIHANASKYKSPKGFEVYYLAEAADEKARAIAARENASLKFEDKNVNFKGRSNLENTLWDLVSDENKRESVKLAGLICREARRKLWVRDRGVKSAGFYVLKGARMPSVLVEVGFLSNRAEEKRLQDAGYRDMAAEAIARGIFKYKDEYEYTQAFTK